MPAAVVRSGKDSKQTATSESLKPIHYALMRPQNEIDLVIFEERLDPIRSEFDYVASAIRISDEIRLNSKFRVAVCRVRPENIDNKLLFYRSDFMNDLKGPSNLFYLL